MEFPTAKGFLEKSVLQESKKFNFISKFTVSQNELTKEEEDCKRGTRVKRKKEKGRRGRGKEGGRERQEEERRGKE